MSHLGEDEKRCSLCAAYAVDFLRSELGNASIKVAEDKEGAPDLARKSLTSRYTKYIDVGHHIIGDGVREGVFDVGTASQHVVVTTKCWLHIYS